MRKFLSIIIPRYSETEQKIFPLLSSIHNQVGIDFNDIEVIIANDGDSIKLDPVLFKFFSFPVSQVFLETNKGPGVARQRGLDISEAQYVMFCDADDRLHNIGVLEAFFKIAEEQASDLITSNWMEESIDESTKKTTYIQHTLDYTWMHGKFLRRKFLTQNNICFHDDLRVHEDSYFLAIVGAAAKRVNHLDAYTYLWKYSPKSITRVDDASYTYNSFPTFIRACCLANPHVERLNKESMTFRVVQLTLYVYFQLHTPNWEQEAWKPYKEESEKTLAKEIEPYFHYYEKAPQEFIGQVYSQERAKHFNGLIEDETLPVWLKRIGLITD